jgi:hypothetical protein
MASCAALFPSWFPPWQGLETLYSWCSRYHLLAGHRLASVTCQRLFGHERRGLSHDLPGSLDALSDRTAGALGTPQHVGLERTVLGYYLAFRAPEVRAAAVDHLRASGAGPLKARLGWLASRMGAAHPLKSCRVCQQQEESQNQIPSWHLVHQLPGVWRCPTHGAPLLFAHEKVQGTLRFQWLLPTTVSKPGSLPLRNGGLALEVARATQDLLDRTSTAPLDVSLMADCFFRGLDANGMTRAARLRPEQCGNSLSSFLSQFSEWPEGDALTVTADAATASLRRLLHPGDRPRHPLRYITAALWLYGSWRAFMSAYEEAAGEHLVPPATAIEIEAEPAHPRGERRLHLLALVKSGSSPSRAAQQVGVTCNTALMWLQQAGESVRQRPKKMDGALRQSVERALRAGKDKEQIALTHGLSVATVTRVLLSNPSLCSRRRETLIDARTHEQRAAWTKLICKHGAEGTAALRRRSPDVYAWLYRNDRRWLQEQSLWRKASKKTSRIDWKTRDQTFEQGLRIVVSEHRAGALSRKEAIALVPGMPVKVRHLSKMPKVAKLLLSLRLR